MPNLEEEPMDTDAPTSAELIAELDPDVDRRAHEPPPWEPQARTSTGVHILAPAPVVEFNPHPAYPSITFFDVSEPAFYATRLDVTLTGSAEQRAAFAARLREVADLFDAWTK